MKHRINHLMLFGVMTFIDIFIKVLINEKFSHLIGVKHIISPIINFYPVINESGLSLAEWLGKSYTSMFTILILTVMLIISVFVYFNIYFMVEKHQKSTILCIPAIMLSSSLFIRITMSFVHGYTIDFISVMNRFICDFADIYLWLGSVLLTFIGLYFMYKEELSKKNMKLSLRGSFKYDVIQMKMALLYYFDIHKD